MWFFSQESDPPPVKESNFKLPIEYLDDCVPIDPVVVTDLELTPREPTPKEPTPESEELPSMYEIALDPSPFGRKTIDQWKRGFSTNPEFLRDSQEIIRQMDLYDNTMKNRGSYEPNYADVDEIWRASKEDPDFYDRYNYIEFAYFKYLNRTPSFLQSMSIINMISPVVSLLMPLLMFIIPFFILKIRGVPVTFDFYLSVFKDIAKNNMFGKALIGIFSGGTNMDAGALLYGFALLGIYGYNMYSNYRSCVRFYDNIKNVNRYLSNLERYLSHSIDSMSTFLSITQSTETDAFARFKADVHRSCSVLQNFHSEIAGTRMFEPSFSKVGEIGSLLKKFYVVHSNKEYESAFKYSIGFEGYVDNVRKLRAHIDSGRMNYCEYTSADTSNNTVFDDMTYPPHFTTDAVNNSCDLSDKSIIISGPNASGKTTYLKTVAINILFSQQFGCGFYRSAKLAPFSRVYSYLNIPDTSGRDSLFQAESRRCKEILDSVEREGGRHFVIFDELYSGTNPEEAVKAAYAFLSYLLENPQVRFLLTTHYYSVCDKLDDVTRNQHMMTEENDDGTIQYLHKIGDGISRVQGGIRVLQNMKYPAKILEKFAALC